MVPNTRKSLNDCTLVRSCSVWVSSTIAEAPTKPKFQPMPSTISPDQKCSALVPVRSIRAATASSTSPMAATGSAPKRAISGPVKKLAPYIATMCH